MKKKLFKGAFLDRDGVINKDLSYVYEKKNFIFQDGIFDLLRILNKKNYLICIVTNQSGIARGLFTELQYKKITDYYINILRNSEIHISGVYHCPHHPDYSNENFKNCNCRKPKPGLFLKAKNLHNIDMNESLAIGDSLRDLEAAYYACIKKRILISKRNLYSKYITQEFKTIAECSSYLTHL